MGRVLAFADPEVIRMAQDDFVPVTCDDWYQRRRRDSEGDFFRLVSDQTPRKASGKSGTRQGVYCFTADGEVLAFKNAGNNAEATREQLKLALAKFDRLPAERRAPGAVKVPPPGRPDPHFSRSLPAGGLAVKVNARILDSTAGGFSPGTCESPGGAMSARDVLWLTAAEVRALVPDRPEVGATFPLPATLTTRLCRYHLVDFTRGEPPFWEKDEVRRGDFSVTVTAVTPGTVELRVDGSALMTTDADPAKADRGYDCRLTGRLSVDRTAKRVTRFEAAAVGEHWGDGPHTKGARPGRGLLGVTFGPAVPASGGVPADRVPPQAARDLADYLGR